MKKLITKEMDIVFDITVVVGKDGSGHDDVFDRMNESVLAGIYVLT